MTDQFQHVSSWDTGQLDALFADIPLRLAHMRDAAAFAQDLGASSHLPDEQQSLLSRSALLHDIGYAPALHCFSFHPLDGALFLAQHHEHPWVLEGVLRHSWAERTVASIPGVNEYYAAHPPEPAAQWLVRQVTMADWRSAGVGGRVSFGQRFQDIVSRNPENTAKIRRAESMVAHVRTCFLDWLCALPVEHPLPWVFCDVDNSLIQPGAGLSRVNKAAVTAYGLAGGRFSLATGKHPRSIVPLVRDLGLTAPQIASNGTCILDGDEIRVVHHLGDAAQELVAGLEAMGLTIAIYRQQGIEAGRFWEDSLDDVFERYGEVRPERRKQSGPVCKVLCIADVQNRQREQKLRSLGASLDVEVCRSDEHFLEFLPRKGNKGQTVRTLAVQAQWPVLHTLAIGDAENDATMFAQCGLCAAVANGTQDARLGADWILPDCAANGVAWILDRLRKGGGWSALAWGETQTCSDLCS